MTEYPIEEGPLPRKRCTVYVDGFNWYYGVFRHFPEWKWLNVQGFFEELRLDEDVLKVKFFTAIVEPDKAVSETRDRLQRYLKALGTLSKVQVILGKYQLRSVSCRADCRKEYRVPEEKKTDVNIAVHMLNDAITKATDSMVLVSGDSDLEPAVEWVRKNCPRMKLTVYLPALKEEQQFRRNDFYRQLGVACNFLPLDNFKKHQFPDKLLLSNGSFVERPVTWRKST
jgi:6-hydroxy-3-succinoylpyridine 3-monooxygenase